jgi:N-acyl-D-amino-acid deacylase
VSLLIRGGTVLDGTGAVGTVADIRTADGLIVEVGPNLRPDGEQEIDASGATVTPGFIDGHTHLDPTLFWDPMCDPMPQHGVTTVMFGNCSLSLAPVRPQDRAAVAGLYCYVEDLPDDTFNDSVAWAWENYADYRAAADPDGFGLNAGGLVGHSMLRMWVMGEDAWERAATEQERAAICDILDQSLADGAFGMSASLAVHEDRANRPVPSRLADDAEMQALVDVLGRRDAVLQFIPTPREALFTDVARAVEWSRPTNARTTWINIFCLAGQPGFAAAQLDQVAELHAAGARTYAQFSPRTMDIRVNWNGGRSFFMMPDGWHRAVQAGPDEKRRLLEDPRWRAVAREEWDRVPATIIPHRHPEWIRFIEVTRPENERWLGRTLADLVAETGSHPSDALADWMLINDLAPGVVGVGVANADRTDVGLTVRHPAAFLSGSDAGAHVQMFCAAGDSTLILARHVRDRGDLSLEQAVHQLTAKQAEVFGFRRRGVIAPGNHADLNVFALDELRWDDDFFVADLPGGGRRLTRPPGGYRQTVVGGVVTVEQGKLTGARPGRFLDGAHQA